MDSTLYRPLPHRGNHKCFGCSPHNDSGLKMKFFTDGSKVVSWPRVPDHLGGWGKIVHGGVTTTMLDEIMGWAAMYLLKRVTLTKSIQVEFLKPIFVGQPLRIEGMPSETVSDREAVMSGFLYNGEDELCARATARFALFTIEEVKRKGIVEKSILHEVAETLFGPDSDGRGKP